MKGVRKESGNNAPQDPEPMTENRKTHDVKPRTEDTELKTGVPSGPAFHLFHFFSLKASIGHCPNIKFLATRIL